MGWEAVTKGIDLADEQAVAALAAALHLTALASNSQLRGDDAAVAASKVSALPAVRAALLEAQRSFAAHPPAGTRGEGQCQTYQRYYDSMSVNVPATHCNYSWLMRRPLAGPAGRGGARQQR